MNKSSFRCAFLALLASSLPGCASPMHLFAKKPEQSRKDFEDFKAHRQADQARIASSQNVPGGQAEIAELLHKGHAAFQQGNLQEAQANYWAVVQRQPNHPVANHRMGVIADRQQDYATAQRYYFAALQSSPRDANLLNDIGYSYLLQQRYGDAEQYLQLALRQNPTQSNALNNLGLLYAKQGQADRALALFRMTNSDAEAQAKLTRLMPSGVEPAAQSGSMLANQTLPPPNSATMNAAPYNVAPQWNGGQNWGNEWAGAPIGTSPPNGLPPNSPNNGWAPPDTMNFSGPSGIAQAGANIAPPVINDPNMPEATRRLKEQMDQQRTKAISERQARDSAEQLRRRAQQQQLREEELGRANIVNPVYSQPNGANRGNSAPNNAPNSALNPNAPIIVGPPPSNWSPNANNSVDVTPPGVPNATNGFPNMMRGQMPPTNGGSPLDTMSTWPTADSLPTITPNGSSVGPGAAMTPSNNGNWPNAYRSGIADDPARAASRMGMNAGPGNMFPIIPGQNLSPPNGVAPTTPSNWSPNQNRPSYGPATGEPPEGTFGLNNFDTSPNSPPQLPESPAQFALQDRLPPSEQYQTPNRFGFVPNPNGTANSPASFAPNRGAGAMSAAPFGSISYPTPNPAQQANSLERGATRATVPDRFGGDDRWQQGPAPTTTNPQASPPSMQGYLPTTLGENSLIEYERMIQTQNAETNLIRQQLDAQRQLPGSENYYRSRTQLQTGTPTGLSPRVQ